MRPKRQRKLGEKCFRSQFKPLDELDGVVLGIDEFKAIRFADVEGFKQEDAVKKMRVSCPTFSRFISSARKKVGDALVNVKVIRIEGKQ